MDKSYAINSDAITLITLYENAKKIPTEQRITDWFGDSNMYEIKYGIDDNTVNKRFNEALKATGYTYSQFCNTPFITNKNKFKHLIERNTTDLPIYEDIFFINKENERIEWMYYNPDSSAGGQYVINYCDYELINRAYNEASSDKDFFEILQNECYQALSDIGTESYEADHQIFCSGTHDFEGMTQETMLNITNSIKKNAIEQYAESFKTTPTKKSEIEYED